MRYQPRTYRRYTRSDDLVSFRVVLSETDLFISCDKNLAKEAHSYVREIRGQIDSYISGHADFKKSLKPVSVPANAPAIIKEMAASAKMVNVGPMAAVAGAIAEATGRQLMKFSGQVIIENGGDIFIASKKPRYVGIYAGESKLSEKFSIKIDAKQTPCGICTSSGTVGHSLSFGKADAVVILSRSASLADAAATAICNRVQTKDDIDRAIGYGKATKGIDGIVIIVDNTIGAWGKVKLVDM